MKAITLLLTIFGMYGVANALQQPTPASMEMHHAHATGAPVSYTELKNTVTILDRARQATAKYQDARVAQQDGYETIGPDVPGMGIHFVRSKARGRSSAFDPTQPPILLYEKNPSAPGGYSLVGVSFLLAAAEGPDGQPLNPPLPKPLAMWHRHENICVLPDRSTPTGLTEKQCQEKGGQFHAETDWMVHAWIWKESPLGVFSPTNPNVR